MNRVFDSALVRDQFMYFVARDNNCTLGFYVDPSATFKPVIQYKIAGMGHAWTNFEMSGSSATMVSCPKGVRVYVRGENTYGTTKLEDMEDDVYNHFVSSGNFDLGGNIRSVFSYSNLNKELGTSVTFSGLFGDALGSELICSIVDASKLLLKYTTLTQDCYSHMFDGCTVLTSAPELPATTLADGCYLQMFYGCTGLTSAPELPATTLADGCYFQMFYGCTGLTSAPELPATTLADDCYDEMFYGCTGLTSAPELPATTLADDCYDEMFSGCTGLTSAPELPATTLVDSCYSNMFNGCTGLTTIEVGFNAWVSSATGGWMNGVAATGTFTCPAELPQTRGISNIPTGWTIVTK